MTHRTQTTFRPSLVSIVAVTVVAIGLSACKGDLYSRLEEREANDMIALLARHGIEAERSVAKDGTSTLRVESKEQPQAIELLSLNGFPKQNFKNMGEMFKPSGLIASPTEERARFIYALSEELSRTISDIGGVRSARLHVVLPKNDLLRQDATPASASVFIRHDPDAPLKSLVPQIKMLVANSIEGLSYDKVSVILVPVERQANQAVPAAVVRQPAPTADWATSEMLFPILAAIGVALAGIAGAFGLGRRSMRRAQPMPVAPAQLGDVSRAELPRAQARPVLTNVSGVKRAT
jgi:type III secretion protein J